MPHSQGKYLKCTLFIIYFANIILSLSLIRNFRLGHLFIRSGVAVAAPAPPPAPPNYATASSLISVLTIFIMPAVITEISPRQQPITARDFTGSNLCHTIKKRIALSQRREGNTAFSGPLSNQSACWKQARPYNKVVARWPGIFAVEDHYVIVCLN